MRIPAAHTTNQGDFLLRMLAGMGMRTSGFRKQGLERTIVHVLENRHEVHEKAKQCLEDIKLNCNPALYGKKLQLLYQGKVSSVAGGGF